jgi:transcriptional regulator GlxA family with amidase domain
MIDHPERGRDRSRLPVYVVVPPRTLLLDVAGPLDVLRRANMVQDRLRFDVHYIGASSSVISSIGLKLADIDPLPRPGALPANAMVVIAGSVDEIMPAMPVQVAPAVPVAPATSAARDGRAARSRTKPSRPQPPDRADRDDKAAEAKIVEWLRASIEPDHLLVSICSGALLAARAGLLDGYACTTHYVSCAELAAIAPHARVLENRLYVEDRQRFSSAGVTAGIDLMLHIVSRLVDHACALAVARYLVVYLRRSGADPQLSPWLEGRNHVHPAIHRVQDAVAADPAREWTLTSLARLAGASSRHLSRLFNEHAGMSITDYRNRLRVALAREMLGHTRLDMEHVAERAGFASPRQLRRAWRQFYATPPKQARAIRQA